MKKAATPKKRISIAGQPYSHDSCHASPGAAKARAVKVRNTEGRKARVLKSGKGWCIYMGGKLKK